jgi:hypothetical protein
MLTTTRIVMASAGLALIAGAANAAVFTLPDFEANDLQPQSFFFTSMTDDGLPVQFGPTADFVQTIFNGSGFDWLSVQFRVIEDPKEVYDVGEFANIFFDPNTAPTVDGDPAPGGAQPFTLTYLEDNQVIRFNYPEANMHEFMESLQYAFTILNENDRDIGYGIQVAFFPIPTPGSAALLAIAALGMTTRRRR